MGLQPNSVNDAVRVRQGRQAHCENRQERQAVVGAYLTSVGVGNSREYRKRASFILHSNQ
jgi:hypothetical protein